MYAFKLLIQNKQRFIMTSLGIALCTLLMLFMVSLYESIADGCVEYVRTSKADLWVLQKHATNIFVLQYAFISLREAQNVVGFHFVVSAYQVKTVPQCPVSDVQANIYAKLKNVVVFDNDTFVKNNIHEMENGIIPLFFIITLITAVVLTAILSLILSVSVLEKRQDFAIIKALGAPHGYITGLVMLQSLLLSLSGLVLGVLLFFPMMRLVGEITPEVANTTSMGQILIVSAGVLLISVLISILPIRKIRKIYPLEVFMN